MILLDMEPIIAGKLGSKGLTFNVYEIRNDERVQIFLYSEKETEIDEALIRLSELGEWLREHIDY